MAKSEKPQAAGGKARAKKLTAKRRREIASLGGKTTWARIRKALSERIA